MYTNPYEIAKFSARLNYEHAVARKTPPGAAQAAGNGTAAEGS